MWVLMLVAYALLQAGLVICRAAEIITCSWWAVFAPVLVPMGIFLLLVIIAILLLIVASQYEQED